MRTKFTVACLLACACLIAGCSAQRPHAAADGPIMDVATGVTIVPGSAEDVAMSPGGKRYEYRAVCIEKERHLGKEQVLSKWAEDQAAVRELGQYHGDHKAKGHRWVVQRREKPHT